jgi:hypothetical protein
MVRWIGVEPLLDACWAEYVQVIQRRAPEGQSSGLRSGSRIARRGFAGTAMPALPEKNDHLVDISTIQS